MALLYTATSLDWLHLTDIHWRGWGKEREQGGGGGRGGKDGVKVGREMGGRRNGEGIGVGESE